MDGWKITILNKWKVFVPKLSVSFVNGWRYKPWIDEGYGKFAHLWRIIIDKGNWLQKFSKDAPDLGYGYSAHLWFLEFGMHVYVG